MNAADVKKGLGLVAGIAPYLPGDVGRYTSIALELAQDFVDAGKSPDDLEALRVSLRAGWQVRLDERFPNG